MPCPTCQHTMHNLGVTDQRIFWCPRCGTIKSDTGPETFEKIRRPSLVRLVKDALPRLAITFAAVGVNIPVPPTTIICHEAKPKQ